MSIHHDKRRGASAIIYVQVLSKPVDHHLSMSRGRDGTMSGRSNSQRLNTPLAGRKRRRTSNNLRQPEQTALRQDRLSPERSSPRHTSTRTSRRTTSPRSSKIVGSRNAPIELPSSGDDSPCALRAGRRRQSASPSTSTASSRPRHALHAPRRIAETRSVSDPLPFRVQTPPPNIDTAIEALIRQPPKTREGKASVYVMTATHNGTPIVKIGFTTSINQRMKKLRQTCRRVEFHPLTTDPYPPLINLYYGMVEKLAHTELQHLQYNFDCTCKTRHIEYFTVDAETARYIVQRWTRFCEARPWEATEAGQKLELKDQWRDRLASWKEERGRPVAVKNTKARSAQWDCFVHTPRWKWLWYDVRVWSEWVSRFLWQVLFVVFCVVIRCLTRDRGWLARGAEGAMVMTVISLGGFRCVAAEGMLEPLLKTVCAVLTAELGETANDYREKAMYQDVWADSSDDDDTASGVGEEDMGNGEDKDGSDNPSDSSGSGDSDDSSGSDDSDDSDASDNSDDSDDSRLRRRKQHKRY